VERAIKAVFEAGKSVFVEISVCISLCGRCKVEEMEINPTSSLPNIRFELSNRVESFRSSHE